MENSVSENTAVVVRRREASTVLAIKAAFVLRLLGKGGAREDILGGVRDGSTGVDVEASLDMMVWDWNRVEWLADFTLDVVVP